MRERERERERERDERYNKKALKMPYTCYNKYLKIEHYCGMVVNFLSLESVEPPPLSLWGGGGRVLE